MPEQLEERVTEYPRLGNSGLKVSKVCAVRGKRNVCGKALSLTTSYVPVPPPLLGHFGMVRISLPPSFRCAKTILRRTSMLTIATCSSRSMTYGNKQWAEWVLEKDEALEHFKVAYEVCKTFDRSILCAVLTIRSSTARNQYLGVRKRSSRLDRNPRLT